LAPVFFTGVYIYASAHWQEFVAPLAQVFKNIFGASVFHWCLHFCQCFPLATDAIHIPSGASPHHHKKTHYTSQNKTTYPQFSIPVYTAKILSPFGLSVKYIWRPLWRKCSKINLAPVFFTGVYIYASVFHWRMMQYIFRQEHLPTRTNNTLNFPK
jgi:hypothetical protein